ncbi:MAG: metallophosphoesterase [Lentisphaerae bacterium]|nr:metallophosphoesterase [Lentisphaerota bacterium]
MRTEHLAPEAPDHTVIRLPGLRRPLVLAHITDSHMSLADARDPEAIPEAARLEALYARHAPDGLSTQAVFAQLMERAAASAVDATVLSGDIINFPAQAAIDHVSSAVSGRPCLYTLGNHDWQFPYAPWTDATRQRCYPRFHALTGGNPAFGVHVLGGVRLIALDNSMYQVSDAQLEFLRAQLASGDPCLLIVHIPLYVESLTPRVIEQWKAPIVMGAEDGWTDETRACWHVGAVEPATRACLELVRRADNLAGVFCGHVHFAHADWLSPTCCQYVTNAGLFGGYREIRLEPAPAAAR